MKMGLRDVESMLPPGFRFYPNDEELVCHYLYKKISNEGSLQGTMVEVDLHTREPWELPEVAKLSANEWYFFSFRDRKYSTGSRANRATKSGYWKATGKDKIICEPGTHNIVGMRKTLVFYSGRAPNGIKTSWVMHEFRLENPNSPPKEDWVLCRVFHKSKGEQENNNMDSSSLTLRSPPHFHGDQAMPNECPNGQLMTSSPNFISNEGNSNSLLNLLDLSQDMESTPMGVVSSRGFGGDDEFGFFYDMGFMEEVHGDGIMDKFF